MLNRLVLGLLALASTANFVSADDTPAYKITTKRDNDRVEVKTDWGKTTFSIHSPFGISQAVIERADENWPDAVVLHLHLKGLENFRVANDKVKLEGPVSPHEDKPLLRLWKDGKEDLPLDAKSLYWMDVRIIGSAGKPAKDIPLKDGYFEMTLPKAFFEGNPDSITVNWIDFYRN